MYQFLLNLWVMNRITETNIQNAVAKGFITQEQADTILATPKAV